jgi:hypothetical protein
VANERQSAYGAALLQLLQSSHGAVLALVDRAQALSSRDPHVVVAYALALTRAKQPQAALEVWQHVLTLRPDDVEVACALADCAIECSALSVAVQALEICFSRDAAAETPAGRRARLLAVKINKLLSAVR